MTRDEFMEAYRNDARFGESLTVEDCKEIFLTVLKGSTDITADLLQELANEYECNYVRIYQALPIEDFIETAEQGFGRGAYESITYGSIVANVDTEAYSYLESQCDGYIYFSQLLGGMVLENVKITYSAKDGIVIKINNSKRLSFFTKDYFLSIFKGTVIVSK